MKKILFFSKRRTGLSFLYEVYAASTQTTINIATENAVIFTKNITNRLLISYKKHIEIALAK